MPHRRNPFGDPWALTYDSSFPTRIVGGFGQTGQSGSRDNLLERKRKLDGFKAEPIGNRRQQCTRQNSYGRSGGGGMPPAPMSQEELRPQSVTPTINSAFSTTHSRLPTNKVHGQLCHILPTVENGGEVKRIINIPVDFNDAAKEMSAVKCIVVPEEGIKKSKRALSTERAAVLLQSWYRGHLLRRTEPLVQLRKIHQVKSKLRELQSQMSNTDFIKRAQQDHKARLWLRESVMDLLLRLDAVQGSHPCVREIRKAATREVVDCQNAIDSLLLVKDSSISKTTKEMTLDGGISDAATAMEIQELEPLVNNLNSMTFSTGEEMEHNVTGNEGVRRDSVPEECMVRDKKDLTMIEDSRNTMIEPDPDQSSSRSEGEGEVLAVVEMKGNADNGTAPVEVESLKEEEGHQGRARDVQTEEGSNSGRNVGDWSKQLEGAHPLTRQPDHDLLRSMDQPAKIVIDGTASKVEGILPEKQSKDQLTKLSEENQALKSLLIGLMKWNQLQATNMQDVNKRLENLESRLLRRSCSNKKRGSSKKTWEKL